MTHLIPLVRGAGPDPRRLRPPAHRGRALAGRPRPPHRPRPLRADLRGVGRRVRRAGLAHPLDPHGRLPRAALRHPELVLAAPLPLARRAAGGDVGLVRLPRRDRPARRRERPARRSCASRCCATAGWTSTGGCGPDDAPALVECECHLPYRETAAAAQPAGPAVRVQRAEPAGRAAGAGRGGAAASGPARTETPCARTARRPARHRAGGGLSGFPYERPGRRQPARERHDRRARTSPARPVSPVRDQLRQVGEACDHAVRASRRPAPAGAAGCRCAARAPPASHGLRPVSVVVGPVADVDAPRRSA